MKKPSNISLLTWSGVAAFAVLAPVAASAQAVEADRGVGVRDRYKAEYEPLGIRAGAFLIRPDLEVAAEYNDNVFAQGTDEESDTVFRIAPSVAIESNWSRNALGLRARVVDWRYMDFSSEDRTDWGVDATGRLDVGARSALRFTAGYENTFESRYDAAAPFSLEPSEYTSTYGSVGFRHEFNRLQIQGDVTLRSYDFKSFDNILGGTTSQDNRDYDRIDYAARADYDLPKGGVVFVEGGFNTRDYDQETAFAGAGGPLNQDSDGYRALVGARVDLTNLLSGEVAAGYTKQSYDDARLSNASGLAVRADLEWFVTGITTIGFGGSREVQESQIFFNPDPLGNVGGGAVVSSVYGRVDHELLRNVVLSGDVAYRDFDYKSFDRNDKRIEAGVGVDYLMNRTFKFGLGYRYDDRKSDGLAAGEEFTANRLIFKVTARL
jgi:hypothetical protein